MIRFILILLCFIPLPLHASDISVTSCRSNTPTNDVGFVEYHSMIKNESSQGISNLLVHITTQNESITHVPHNIIIPKIRAGQIVYINGMFSGIDTLKINIGTDEHISEYPVIAWCRIDGVMPVVHYNMSYILSHKGKAIKDDSDTTFYTFNDDELTIEFIEGISCITPEERATYINLAPMHRYVLDDWSICEK